MRTSARDRLARVAVLVLMAGLGACGGSHAKITTASPPAPSVPRAASPVPEIVLAASANGPTTCTVYSGYVTQVIFDSQSLNVSPECQAWSGQGPGSGYLWGYEPTTAALDAAAVRVCALRDRSGRVRATVVEDAGFNRVSAADRAKGARACTRMRAGGWVGSGKET